MPKFFSVYIDIGTGSGNTVTATFAFADSTTARQWDIKVSQIECSNPSRSVLFVFLDFYSELNQAYFLFFKCCTGHQIHVCNTLPG